MRASSPSFPEEDAPNVKTSPPAAPKRLVRSLALLSVALIPIVGCSGAGVAQSATAHSSPGRSHIAAEGEPAAGRDPDRQGAALGALQAGIGATVDGGPAVPAPVAPRTRFGPTFTRGVYGSDSSATGFDDLAAAGFNTVEVSPDWESLDLAGARGLRAFVWLGGWSNGSCAFDYPDEQVRSLVGAIAGHSALQFYYVGDEPSIGACPNGPAAYRGRTALIHSIDPQTPTFTVISTWDEPAYLEFPYGPWVGAVDIVGLDVYPCAHGYACDFDLINQAIAQAARVGLTRYYAVLQAFEDDFYRMPSASELQEQFARWQQSQMEGYLVFNWDYAGTTLAAHPSQVAQLQLINGLAGRLPEAALLAQPDVSMDEDREEEALDEEED